MFVEIPEARNSRRLDVATWHPKTALQLCAPEETDVPPAVQRTIKFVLERNIWFQLSRNREARSCRDAAHKRNRLGHEGIPLCDELKSYFGIFTNAGGNQQPFLAHCRGDRLIDIHKLAEALNARGFPTRMTEEDLKIFGLEYGLVNPFGIEEALHGPNKYALDAAFLASSILQVFDTELRFRVGVPGSMMTNAGDLTWAVEFFPDKLIDIVDNAIVEPIAISDPKEAERPWGIDEQRIIGIITGNGPESGMLLWNHINNNVREILDKDCYGDFSMPRVIVNSLPEMGLSMELDCREGEIWHALRSAVVNLARQGVRFLVIADNTTQYFTPQIRALCSEYKTEFISLPETLAGWLHSHSITQVALVGISYVSELGPWSAYREPLSGFDVVSLSESAKEQVNKLAYRVKTDGVSEASLNRLRDILRREVNSDTVILGLTELSLLLQEQKSKKRSGKLLIDPLMVYADVIARRYLFG
jgi:aspartate/glutamate racemase